MCKIHTNCCLKYKSGKYDASNEMQNNSKRTFSRGGEEGGKLTQVTTGTKEKKYVF